MICIEKLGLSEKGYREINRSSFAIHALDEQTKHVIEQLLKEHEVKILWRDHQLVAPRTETIKGAPFLKLSITNIPLVVVDRCMQMRGELKLSFVILIKKSSSVPWSFWREGKPDFRPEVRAFFGLR